MGSLKILDAGLYSSIQDTGRLGLSNLGIPKSGVMDTYAYRYANILLGNSENDAVIEMTWQGARLLFNNHCQIVISGARAEITLNDKKIFQDTVLHISPLDELNIGRAEIGFRIYLAILGGFQTSKVLNSRSQYKHITERSHLKRGDVINYNTKYSKANNSTAHAHFNLDYFSQNILNVYKGPEFSQLSNKQQEQLFNQKFTISQYSNRMAYQFEEKLPNTLSSLLTSPVLPGTIQLTPSGQLICLMRDCQSTGGYPRILQLSRAACDVLAQKPLKAKVGFKKIDF